MTIDFPEFIRPPRLSTDGGILLGIRLLKSKPADLDDNEKRALRGVRAAVLETQRVGKARARLRPENLQDEDERFDERWGAVYTQLGGWARLENDPRGEQARRLLASLFPDGLMFLTRSYGDEWVQSQERLQRIEEEGLEDSLVSLVHPDLLREVRKAHDALGEGLGVGDEPLPPLESRAMLDALRTLSLAISDYARVLAGRVERGDADSERRYLQAMAPLELFRASRGRGSGEDEVDPSAPVPPADDGPVVDDDPDVDPPVLDEPVPPVG